ncbi:KAT8 regulatory NSL complex subunit 1-like protein isoform X2 [Cololabis saira]|uniref:KAT8 regulatory NSL complex subunit 1-like protein isoform X2 n=1 Tax=Cololabis saira TaxID=129043 RepID=UPI002AD2217B|nr:KAT8 regulatory NSL complex subunit 1-like protein isoform X2 [Cololabis saira]
MAPAPTRILQNDHCIHLSSPPASVRSDPDDMRSPDHSDLLKMWLNVCSVKSLDLWLSSSPLDAPLDAPVDPGLSTCSLQTSSCQCEMMPLPSPDSLASFLSRGNSHQEAAVFPGVSDMFSMPVSEQNSPEACLQHGWSAAPECLPGAGDGHCSSLPLTSVFPSYPCVDVSSWSQIPLFVTQSTMLHEKAAGIGCPPPPPPPLPPPRLPPPPAAVQPGIGMVIPDKVASASVLEEAVKEQLSRKARLQGRAQGLQRRLQTLLGEHASLHCSQQLDGLNKHCQLRDVSPDSLGPVHLGSTPPQACSYPDLSWQELSAASPSSTELREFSHSCQVVLRGLQEALDSEVTGSSSSSDEEPEEDKTRGKISPASCRKRQWLEERAELGSRWSWLQLRVAELEGRIKHLAELHKHIRSTKGGVMLADPQSLKNRKIQQSLERGMTGFSCGALDADAEPCSPARLLHNIERQSAQLSQIVNSLMPPLGFSPLSKQPQNSKGRASFGSGQRGDDVSVSGSSKRRRLGARRLFKADTSCVCARTRPLLTYHKPKLFTFNSDSHASPPSSRGSTSTLSSSLSSSSCLCGSSCDPVVLCSDPHCSSSAARSPSVSGSRPYSATRLSWDSPACPQSHGATAREEWSQRPLVINTRLFSPANFKRNSSTPRHNGHKYKKHGRHRKDRVLGLSPIGSSCSGWSRRSRSDQRKRKKGRVRRLIDDRLCDVGESSDEVLEESYAQDAFKQTSRVHIPKRQRESVYNINNVIIPVMPAKVEKLQYKDILTPSWREVDAVTEVEAEEEEWQLEDLGDEVFAQRHLALEQKEKLRWSSSEMRKCCRPAIRSVSRLSGSGSGVCTSGEESSAEWSRGQLDSDEQLQSEEWLIQEPWDPRAFPLDADHYPSELSDEAGELPSGWTDCTSTFHTSKNSSSHNTSVQSAGATLPPHGQRKSCTLSVS